MRIQVDQHVPSGIEQYNISPRSTNATLNHFNLRSNHALRRTTFQPDIWKYCTCHNPLLCFTASRCRWLSSQPASWNPSPEDVSSSVPLPIEKSSPLPFPLRDPECATKNVPFRVCVNYQITACLLQQEIGPSHLCLQGRRGFREQIPQLAFDENR